MRLLLDTHLLLWALGEPGRLDRTTRAVIEDTGNDVLFSAASIWEIAIKAALGRMDFRVGPEAIVQAARRTGFVELPVHAAAAALVADLPPHHRDPFDRLLIAQAMAEPARLYTADPILPPYSELVTLVGA
ncbi:type II toxin-antitoxin system VapC family toxin [Lichenicoccus sp.]|uniref:type II toxin-antitoxin system VapC family toxin n=1 Tax=Lichenicoccus sp. TaxID=2781899 RepID=UPI003D09D596